jgi:hypothetical protein
MRRVWRAERGGIILWRRATRGIRARSGSCRVGGGPTLCRECTHHQDQAKEDSGYTAHDESPMSVVMNDYQLPRSPNAAITFDKRRAALLQFVSTA